MPHLHVVGDHPPPDGRGQLPLLAGDQVTKVSGDQVTKVSGDQVTKVSGDQVTRSQVLESNLAVEVRLCQQGLQGGEVDVQEPGQGIR